MQELHTFTEGKLNIGTGNSGTDLIMLFVHALFDLWEDIFGLHFQVIHSFACDNAPVSQAFLQAHWKPGFLFQEMAEVAEGGMAHDVLSDAPQPVPSVFMWAAGIECDTLSLLNTQSRVGEGVVSSGEGKTGTSAQWTLRFVETRFPEVVLLECVRGLANSAKPVTPGCGNPKQSDIDAIVEWLNLRLSRQPEPPTLKSPEQA